LPSFFSTCAYRRTHTFDFDHTSAVVIVIVNWNCKPHLLLLRFCKFPPVPERVKQRQLKREWTAFDYHTITILQHLGHRPHPSLSWHQQVGAPGPALTKSHAMHHRKLHSLTEKAEGLKNNKKNQHKFKDT
jgi:hypothetical protein